MVDMKNAKPVLWGAVLGAAACAILGFTWGGWVTGSTARKDLAEAARGATVTALAPLCADRFRAQGDAPARLADLAKASSWERSSVVEKSGFAVLPGGKSSASDLARACVDLLLAPPKT
jgi:hypothetical protein